MLLLYVCLAPIRSKTTPVTVVCATTATSSSVPTLLLFIVPSAHLWQILRPIWVVILGHWHRHIKSFLFSFHWVELLIIEYDVGDAKFIIALLIWLRLLVLHLFTSIHSRFFVDFLAVHHSLDSSPRRVLTWLGILSRPIFTLMMLLLLLVQMHHSRCIHLVTLPLTIRIVVADVVDVLLTNWLHVELTFFLRVHSRVWVLMLLLLSLCFLGRCVTIHLVNSLEVLVMKLRLGHHDTWSYLVSLVSVLGVIHLIFGDLRAQTLILMFVNWNLTNVSLWNDSSTLILIYSSVSSNTFYTVRCHRRISWWG